VQVALVSRSVRRQYVSPPEPGQHVVPDAGVATHDPAPAPAPQQMSFAGSGVHVPGAPPVAPGPLQTAAFVSHAPVILLQTSPDLHCASRVHLPHVFGALAPQIDPFALPAQSEPVQQSPRTQRQPAPEQSAAPPAAQHWCDGLAAQAPVAPHVAETHWPLVAPAVAQIVPDPYVASVWHCVSVVHGPQTLGVARPQISFGSPFATLQSASVTQLPATQLPRALQTYDVEPPP
jgi:hypothetical protein